MITCTPVTADTNGISHTSKTYHSCFREEVASRLSANTAAPLSVANVRVSLRVERCMERIR